MEFILILVLAPFAVAVGMGIGRLIPVMGDRICEFNSYIKSRIGASPEEILLTSIFVAVTATFWKFNSALGPIWINIIVKVAMTIASVLLVLLLAFNLVIHFVEECKRQ